MAQHKSIAKTHQKSRFLHMPHQRLVFNIHVTHLVVHLWWLQTPHQMDMKSHPNLMFFSCLRDLLMMMLMGQTVLMAMMLMMMDLIMGMLSSLDVMIINCPRRGCLLHTLNRCARGRDRSRVHPIRRMSAGSSRTGYLRIAISLTHVHIFQTCLSTNPL